MSKAVKIYIIIVGIIIVVAFIVIPDSKKTTSRQNPRVGGAYDDNMVADAIRPADFKPYLGTIQSAIEHTNGLKWHLKKAGFYRANPRQQKIIATNAMLALEGNEYDDLEQVGERITVFSNIYVAKNLVYQLGISYNSRGLMELKTLQVLYADPSTGEVHTTSRIK